MHRSIAPSQSGSAAPMCYTNHTDESGLPSEAQLTLLCLDYLRSLRRSYQNKQDLLNGAGLHADHISLAIWSLSRAFACPELTFGAPKVSTVVEEGEEVKIVGGGGVAGSEDECVGNDSIHRLLNDSSRNVDKIEATPKAMFALTDSIKLPSMKDITNEILLSYSDDARDEGCLQYEYYDMHSSNSHRFYLLNGMAGEAIDGEPLTLCDLTAVALSTLNAKSRIEADKEVEQDPLFKDFVAAAEKNGFFMTNGKARQSAEEEALRQRVLHESKYRKVLAKFRSKLAVKEEQEVSNGPLWALKALANAHSVSDRLETRRDRMIEQVKELRVEEKECDVEKASYEELIGDIARLEKKKSKMQMETEALSAVIAKKDAALADANDSIHDLKNDLNDLLDNRSALESKLEDVNNEHAKSQSHIKELIACTERIEEYYKSQVSTVKEELENKKKVLDVADEEIGVLNDALSKEKSLNETLSGDIALKVLEKEKLQSEVDDLTAVKAKHEAAIAKAAAEAAALNTKIEELQDAATKTVDDLKLERSVVDANVKTLKKDLKKALKVIAKLESNEKKLIEHVLASAEVPASPAVKTTTPRVLPPSPNGVECAPFTPPKSSKKQANSPLPDNDSVPAPPSPPHLTRQAMMNPPSTKKASLVSAFPAENLPFHQEAEGINAQGNELMQKKQFSEALEQFTTALKLSPDGPNSHIYYTSRAAAYCQLGQYADAADDCRKSIELNDTYEEAYSRYSMCLFHLGDVKGSVAAQKKAFDLARNAYRSDLSTLG